MAKDPEDPGTEDFFADSDMRDVIVTKHEGMDQSDAGDSGDDLFADVDLDDDDDDDDDDDVDVDLDDDDDDGSDDDDDDDDDDAGSDDDDDDAGDDDDDAGDGKKTKRQKSFDDRIRELTTARKNAERAQFKAELALQDKPATQLAGDDDIKIPPEPKVADFKFGEVDPEYIDALVDHRAAKKAVEVTAKQRKDFQTQSETDRNKVYGDKLSIVMVAGTKKHPDFEEVVGSTTFDASLARLILDSDHPVDIAYGLSNNIGTLRKVTQMSSTERARFIGRLEGKLSAPSAGKKRTKAPDVIGKKGKRPVKAGKSGGRYGPDNAADFDKAFFADR